MKILDNLLVRLPDRKVLAVCIGLHWTAVVIQKRDQAHCGLGSTLPVPHHHSTEPDVPQASQLHTLSGLDLSRLANTGRTPLTSIGILAVNALLPPQSGCWRDVNAEEVIASHGADKTVAVIGSFPFT